MIMSRRHSEPSSPRYGRLLRQVKNLKTATDEFARLWQHSHDSEHNSVSFDGLKEPQSSLSLSAEPPLAGQGDQGAAGLYAPSDDSLNSLVQELSQNRSRYSLTGSVLCDISDMLLMPPAEDKKKPKQMRQRAKSARAFTSSKYATPATKSKSDGQKLTAFFGLAQEDVEFSNKYRKLIRTFGHDFPSHAAVLSIIAENKRARDCDIHRRPAKLYNDGEVSDEQVRQRKKLESFAGLTKTDYDNFMLQMKLFQKLGEHVPIEALHAKKRSASLPPELLALGKDATKVERMLGAKKSLIAGQDKAKKAARIFGEQLPQDYCEELAKLAEASSGFTLHSRKTSMPVTEEEMKQAEKGTGGGIRKKLGKSPSKKAVGFGGAKKGPKKNSRNLSIVGTGLSKGKSKGGSPVKGGASR